MKYTWKEMESQLRKVEKKGPVFSEEIDNLERGGIAERNVKDNKRSCIRENKSW